MDLGRPDDYAQAAEDFAAMREQFLPDDSMSSSRRDTAFGTV
jgi:hypothetical protein